MASQKEENVQKEEIVQKEESTHEEKSTQEEDYPLIPRRMSGTRPPYTEEDISPLLPPLLRRQDAVQVDVTEVVAVAGVRAW